ncbi:cytochrome P450 [Sodiomyces alkalinus F11]|uniref:Cytochrome P450 n=1 Tax=Sodiomyces alkalinus (strain CBS 110278 / VKM F-3762 / F11) TaxID=1314773 RepID=A0A3N2PMC6_SODAK|nr:cytochrome P450 [Sodiomyces alkalinus F11]ROT35564.1 cytochrome P450 [Sodiomyces alkalinus F11]
MESPTPHTSTDSISNSIISPTTRTGLVLLLVALYALYRALLPKTLPGIPYNESAAQSILGDLPSMLRTIKSGSVMEWFVAEARKHNAPLCQVLQPFGGKPFLLLSDSREAQDLLLRQAKAWDRSDWSIAILGGLLPYHHINLKTDAAWKSHRRLLQDLMTPGFLHGVAAPNIYGSAMRLVELWRVRARAADGRPFEAVTDVYYAALDAVFEFSFADSFPHRALVPQLHLARGMEDGEVRRLREEADRRGRRQSHGTTSSTAVQDAVVEFPVAPLHESVRGTMRASEIIGDIGQAPEPTLAWWWKSLLPEERRHRRARNAFLEEEVRKAVERHREAQGQARGSQEAEKDRNDNWFKGAVDLMIDRETKFAEKEGRDPVYWSPVMRDEVLGFVIAGHDTSSTTLLWGLKFLTDHPGVRSTLRDALRTSHAAAARDRRAPSAEEIARTNKVAYLDAVVEEILRCGCTVPLLERQATTDTTLLGHFIPRGTTILVPIWGPSMSEPACDVDEALRSPTSQAAGAKGRGGPKTWDEEGMDQFRPERWLATDGETGDTVFDSAAGPMLTFGLGMRGCFGRRLAYLELKIMITLIVWHFELLPCAEQLSGYAAYDELTRKPRQCFVRLKETEMWYE